MGMRGPAASATVRVAQLMMANWAVTGRRARGSHCSPLRQAAVNSSGSATEPGLTLAARAAMASMEAVAMVVVESARLAAPHLGQT